MDSLIRNFIDTESVRSSPSPEFANSSTLPSTDSSLNGTRGSQAGKSSEDSCSGTEKQDKQDSPESVDSCSSKDALDLRVPPKKRNHSPTDVSHAETHGRSNFFIQDLLSHGASNQNLSESETQQPEHQAEEEGEDEEGNEETERDDVDEAKILRPTPDVFSVFQGIPPALLMAMRERLSGPLLMNFLYAAAAQQSFAKRQCSEEDVSRAIRSEKMAVMRRRQSLDLSSNESVREESLPLPSSPILANQASTSSGISFNGSSVAGDVAPKEAEGGKEPIILYDPEPRNSKELTRSMITNNDPRIKYVNDGMAIKNPFAVDRKIQLNILTNMLCVKLENGSYKCNGCNRVTEKLRPMQQHLLSHSASKFNLCIKCLKGFNDKYDMKRHTRKHTFVKPFLCPECNRAFSQRCSLEGHRKKIHHVVFDYAPNQRRETVRVCERCGFSCTGLTELLSHLNEQHPADPCITRISRQLERQMERRKRVSSHDRSTDSEGLPRLQSSCSFDAASPPPMTLPPLGLTCSPLPPAQQQKLSSTAAYSFEESDRPA